MYFVFFLRTKIDQLTCYQKERIDFARLRMAKRMIDRNGKAKESIVKGWSLEERWIRKVKENLRRYGIGEDEFEELE